MGLELPIPQVEGMTLKLLVSGGLGFIGSNFVHHMLNKHGDVQITNIDKLGWIGEEI